MLNMTFKLLGIGTIQQLTELLDPLLVQNLKDILQQMTE